MDDLSAPLGLNRAQKHRSALPTTVSRLVIGFLSIFIAVFAGWAMLAKAPFGGPMAVARTEPPTTETNKTPDMTATIPAAAERAARPESLAAEAPPPAAPPRRTITIIDGTSGKSQAVVIPEPSQAAPDKAEATGEASQRYAELSPHGLLPKIAADGSRPSEIYARPVKAIAGKATAPRIAIVVGGLGVSVTGTSDAMKLPGAVTLAFSPQASGVEQLAARAQPGP